jgi:hypothetical protein
VLVDVGEELGDRQSRVRENDEHFDGDSFPPVP